MGKRGATTSLPSVREYLVSALDHFDRECRHDLVCYYRHGLEVVSTFMFGMPAEVEVKRVYVADVQCPDGKGVPPWKAELLSRPLRKIVNVRVVREQEPRSRSWLTHWEERLECGHTHIHIPFMPDEQRARRRRCKECLSLKRSVQSIITTRPKLVESVPCTSVNTAERPLRHAPAAPSCFTKLS